MTVIKFHIHGKDIITIAESLAISCTLKMLGVDSIRIDGQEFSLKRIRREMRRLA